MQREGGRSVRAAKVRTGGGPGGEPMAERGRKGGGVALGWGLGVAGRMWAPDESERVRVVKEGCG